MSTYYGNPLTDDLTDSGYEEAHGMSRLPVKPWTAETAIEQIKRCGFECEGGAARKQRRLALGRHDIDRRPAMIADCETCTRKQVPCKSCQESQRAICYRCVGDVDDPYGEVAPPLTYSDIYRNLDGMTALATATATPLRHEKDEKDTAFVKRIVATYMKLAHDAGVHRC